MILEFTIQNFRSIKGSQTFSMIAESSKIKSDNVFEVSLPKGDSVRLLKTAMIYGANASGKSNLIRALDSFIQMIVRRIDGAGRPVRGYDPFLFATETLNEPTIFEIVFVYESIKYKYRVVFNRSYIIEEKLIHFPKGQSNTIFERLGAANEISHKIKLSKEFGYKEFEVFNTQLGLNKFGIDTPHDLLSKLYVYFISIEVNNAMRSAADSLQIRRTSQRFSAPEMQFLFKRLERLIQIADTKIDRLEVAQLERPASRRISGTENIVTENIKYTQIYGMHKMYDNGIEVGVERLDFNEESEGTKALFWRGGLILEKLEQGGILVFDELDNSLHPKLVKFLVKLFSNPRSNPNNAQLIFATHEVTLLDRDIFRTDQIWFAEKNKFGETEIFSAQDFEGVREDVPFDKWYMAGKFGGLPKIEDIESVFTHE